MVFDLNLALRQVVISNSSIHCVVFHYCSNFVFFFPLEDNFNQFVQTFANHKALVA